MAIAFFFGKFDHIIRRQCIKFTDQLKINTNGKNRKLQNFLDFKECYKSLQKVSNSILKKEIPSSQLMFWCHNCQLPINPVHQIQCELCFSEAIEQFSSQQNPQNFQPYVSDSNNQANSTNSNNRHSSNQASGRPIFSNFFQDPLGIEMMQSMHPFRSLGSISAMFTQLGDNDAPVFIRYTVTRPTFGILLLNTEEEEKVSVSEQKINSLQKIQIKEECAICQQKNGSGLKLPCNHEFHENCIKPWFQQANTCPCCRTTV